MKLRLRPSFESFQCLKVLRLDQLLNRQSQFLVVDVSHQVVVVQCLLGALHSHYRSGIPVGSSSRVLFWGYSLLSLLYTEGPSTIRR